MAHRFPLGILILLATSGCQDDQPPTETKVHTETTDTRTAVAAPVYVQLSVGYLGLCARDDAGRLTCWSAEIASSAVQMFEVDTEGTYQDLSVGSAAVCAVTTEGALACWSDDEQEEFLVEQVPEGQFVGVASGEFYAVGAWTAEGETVWWGNTNEEFITYSVRDLQLGNDEACYVDVDGGLICWANGESQGDDLYEPDDVVQIDLYDSGSPCLRTSSRSLVCLDGEDLSGLPTGGWSDFSLGNEHGCALTLDGYPWCWGDNRWDAANAPYRPYVDIEAYGDSTCALTASNTIECWGYLAELGLFPAE